MPILPQTHPLKKVEDRVKNRQMSRREGAQVDFECKVVPKIFDNAIQTGFKNALK